MVTKKLLSNNVMLITEPIVKSSTIAIGFWFSVGSRSESKGCYGITHFTEHLIFKGTTTRTTHDIACTFDRIGGYINAYTEREYVCVYCVIPSSCENIKTALDVLCDIADNAIFPQDELDRERVVVENEVTAYLDDAEESALDYVSCSVWPNQSISQSITGTIDDVRSLSRSEIIEWYKKYFVSGELTVSISGNIQDFDFENSLRCLSLRKSPVEYPKFSHYNEDIIWNSGSELKNTGFNQGQIFLLYPLSVPLSEEEYYNIAVFNAVVGDTMSSRLFESLREKSGYCYNVYSFYSLYEGAGLWCAYCSCDKKHSLDVIELLQKEMDKLLTDDFTDEEINIAKEHLCGEECISSEDMEYCIKRNQRNYSLGFNMYNVENSINAIRRVQKDDIIELAHKLVNNENKSVIYYGPKLNHKMKKEILCRIK